MMGDFADCACRECGSGLAIVADAAAIDENGRAHAFVALDFKAVPRAKLEHGEPGYVIRRSGPRAVAVMSSDAPLVRRLHYMATCPATRMLERMARDRSDPAGAAERRPLARLEWQRARWARRRARAAGGEEATE